ncbi:MAG: prepilin-type N-terminal cleavage/methylation domain-containing protein [Candidatus Omnitrophica bacterium]|nr:prepilin-type N-terminal cleavage/methylation domain-containing protein [Candidatus Omnitrophota bacterium]
MKKGFTLLELLIGMSVFAIVAASVYSSLYLGVKVWKQEENLDQMMQEAVLSLKVMERALRCAFLNPENEKISFVGLGERIDFFSTSPEGGIEKVAFYLRPNEGDNSFSLLRSKVMYTRLDDEEAPREEVINTKIRELKLKYFSKDENIWHEIWPEELILPQEVSIEVNFAPAFEKSGSFDLVKYINIPMANIMDLTHDEESQ